MRRLFGLKSKSSSNSDRPPLEPLSTNTDHRSNGKHSSVKGKQRASSPSQPTSTAAEADTGSLHAHFASPPALVHPLPSPSPLSEPTEGDKGASALVAGSSSGSSRGAGSAGPGSGKVTESRASSAHGTTSSEAGRDQQQRRDSSPAPPVQQQQPNGAALQRTISPLSFVPSQSPYYSAASVGGSVHPSLARVVSSQQHHQDPNAIYAPTTWSELANPELVDNVSNRERTRQEILWEVVASEERYVLELRSLIKHYVNPLLHPLLSPTPRPPPPPTSAPSSRAFSPSSSPSLSPPSSSELPIAARFQRSSLSNNTSEVSLSVWQQHHTTSEMPEINASSDSLAHDPPVPAGARSHMSLPVMPRGVEGGYRPSFSIFGSSHSLAAPYSSSHPSQQKSKGRLSSFSFRPRPSPPPASTSAPPKPSLRALNDDGTPLVLPDELRNVLEALGEMLKGHEELSGRLKDQWERAFPLVRGLAAIWSEQPWFLPTYARYILSLEACLSTLDSLLPSLHPSSPSTSTSFLHRGDKVSQRLAKVLVSLEEQAAQDGESGLGICLSKPLMRLSKLPLLMQALLFHTDPTTHEWEKTRAMALEVDALVRSIEDEKIDEEARERTRDAYARIEGIRDKALMAPRSSRVLISESPCSPSTSASSTTRRTTSRKLTPSSKGKGKEDWFVRFSDVTLRCVKIRETDLPGGFSRGKEKMGKQGKVKKGKLRNLYRFVRVEKWELAVEGIDEEDAGWRESSELDEEEDLEDVESRMSFRYDSDDPKPSAPLIFNTQPTSLPKIAGQRSSSATHSVVTRQSPALAKHGGRLRIASEGSGPRATSPVVSRHRFEAPTKASAAKVASGPPRDASPPRNGLHAREDSVSDLLQAYWRADGT